MNARSGGQAAPARHDLSWARSPALVRVCVLVSALAVVYGLYRGYYALGGTAGMVGEYASRSQWLMINAVGAIALLVSATVPLVALPLSRWRGPRTVLLVLFSVAAVGLTMHALTDEFQRVLSVTGLAARWHITLTSDSMAGWIWRDQRASDLQDMFLNEPWFLLEGVLCGVVVWLALGPTLTRRVWLGAVLIAVAAFTAYGIVSAVGILGRSIIF